MLSSGFMTGKPLLALLTLYVYEKAAPYLGNIHGRSGNGAKPTGKLIKSCPGTLKLLALKYGQM